MQSNVLTTLINVLFRFADSHSLFDISGSLELIVFSTGDQTPTFRNMKMLECSEGSRDVLCTPHSWSNINKPPVGLDKMANYQLVLQCDLQLIADDFKMIYRTRLGSQK